MTGKAHSKNPTLKLAAAGIMATLAFEPFSAPIFLVPAFYILLEQVYLATPKKAFYSGFVFGFFHFMSSFYWLGVALTSNVGNFLWLIPFAVLLVPAFLSLYIGLACIAASYFRKSRFSFIVAFSLIWVIAELVRGYVPLPFPWNFMGYTLTASPYSLALAPLLGLHLCSLAVVFLASILFSRDLSLVAMTYLLCLLGIIIIDGDGNKPTMFWDETIRIVQPNLAEHHIGKADSQRHAMSTLSEFSTIPSSSDRLTAIIWPEASYPYLFHETDPELAFLSTLAPKGGYLIAGADRLDTDKRLYNSIIAIGSDAKLESSYDKHTLVPFGEYVPFRIFLPFLDKIAYGMYEFTPGAIYNKKLGSITLRYYPLVCYEVIFPIKQDLTHYEWLLNVTNDAWYGRSSGPYQHFAMSRFKAAEYGMPLIRVANTGISGVISPFGEVLEQIGFNTRNFIDIRIPKKIKLSHTLLRDNQNIFLCLFFLICLYLNLALRIKPAHT